MTVKLMKDDKHDHLDEALEETFPASDPPAPTQPERKDPARPIPSPKDKPGR